MLSRVNLHRFLSATEQRNSVFQAKGLNKVWDKGFIASKNSTIGSDSTGRRRPVVGEGYDSDD